MSDETICMHILVKGRVQGVGFRDAAYQTSKKMGDLKGWVRNLDNGDVEILVQSTRAKVEEFEQWCHKGPPSARIDVVLANQVKVEPGLMTFSIRKF